MGDVRRVDAQATEEARKRHEQGVERLRELFAFEDWRVPFVPLTGRAVGMTKIARLRWRQWADGEYPPRVKRRRRRKLARASRARNRR